MQKQLLSKRFQYLLLAALSALILTDLYIAFSSTFFKLGHDEAEHMYVIYALQRGERPYLDFVENHPVLLHGLYAKVLGQLGEVESIRVYLWAKAFIAAHCIGTLTLFFLGTRKLLDSKSTLLAAVAWLSALTFLGIWKTSSSLELESQPIWQLRPDWPSYFYATLALYLHYQQLTSQLRGYRNRHGIWLMAIGGICAGLSLAILPKAIYLFVPYAVTLLALLPLLPWHEIQSCWRKYRPSLLADNAVFLACTALTLGVGIAIEIHVDQIDLHTYMQANFTFNTQKHIVFHARDGNPASVLASISGLGLAGTVLLGLFAHTSIVRLYSSRQIHCYAILFFCISCLLLNALIPAFSNGLTWPQYFIPSLLALSIVFAYALISLYKLIRKICERSHPPPAYSIPSHLWPWLKRTLVIALIIQSSLLLKDRINETRGRYENQSFSRDLYFMITGDRSMEFLPDRYLPPDLAYLTFSPVNMPLKARVWGYYFMLFPDRKALADMHQLGLAPELASHWKAGFGKSPPDAILILGKQELDSKVVVTRLAGNGDLSWLWKKIEPAYTCRHTTMINVFVRNDLLHRFPSPTWSECGDEQPKEE